jgi:hypothetical protein
MNDVLALIFVNGIEVAGVWRQMLMFPLCLSIAVVYKTTRCESLQRVPVAAIVLWITIVICMYAVGVGLWALFSVLA